MVCSSHVWTFRLIRLHSLPDLYWTNTQLEYQSRDCLSWLGLPYILASLRCSNRMPWANYLKMKHDHLFLHPCPFTDYNIPSCIQRHITNAPETASFNSLRSSLQGTAPALPVDVINQCSWYSAHKQWNKQITSQWPRCLIRGSWPLSYWDRGLNPAQCIDVCPRLPVSCYPVEIEDLSRADPPSGESYQTSNCFIISEVIGNQNKTRRPGPWKLTMTDFICGSCRSFAWLRFSVGLRC